MPSDITTQPYSAWLESVLRELVDIDPMCIALEMRDADGVCYTCYWNTSADDRILMIDSMQDDAKMEWFKNHKDELIELLNDEEDGDDGLCEADTETDSEK